MKKVILLTATTLFSVCASFSQAADRNILWDKVHNQCQTSYDKQGIYAPCTLVDEDNDYVFYKVDNDKYQYLLLPLTGVSGIEDKQLLAENAPRYFAMSWWGRDLVAEKTGHRIREKDISLTVNSINTRSQDQLHIHISCLAKPVREALDRFDPARFGSEWYAFPEKLQGYDFYFKKLSKKEFESGNLFNTASQKVAQDGQEMQYATLAVANLDKDNFLLLLGEGTKEQRIGAEKLQDHTCALMDK